MSDEEHSENRLSHSEETLFPLQESSVSQTSPHCYLAHANSPQHSVGTGGSTERLGP